MISLSPTLAQVCVSKYRELAQVFPIGIYGLALFLSLCLSEQLVPDFNETHLHCEFYEAYFNFGRKDLFENAIFLLFKRNPKIRNPNLIY